MPARAIRRGNDFPAVDKPGMQDQNVHKCGRMSAARVLIFGGCAAAPTLKEDLATRDEVNLREA
jgi:hypothetical protein